MSQDEIDIRAEERREVRNVVGYFKREFANLNKTTEMNHVFDGLLRELEAAWSMLDNKRSDPYERIA